MSGLRAFWAYYCHIIVFELLLLSLQTDVGTAQDNENGYYMVSAAGTIFSGRPYGVVVGIFESKVSCSCEVFLKGPNVNMSIELNMTPLQPMSSYRFELPELSKGKYWLTVNSLRGLNFTNTTQLTWRNFKNFIKIQTPKTNYRVGELLQFRVFFHNETMNGVNPEFKANIWIEDAKGFNVKLYDDFVVNKGVFQSDLRLSRTPNLGRWRICAKNGLYVTEQCLNIHVKEDDISLNDNVTLTNRPIRHIKRPVTKNKTHRLRRSAPVEKNRSQETAIEGDNLFANRTTKGLLKVMKRGRPFKKKHPNLVKLDYGEPRGSPEIIKFQLDYKPSYSICVIMFNGLILASALIFPDKTNTFSLEVQLTMKIWPYVHVLIYGMESNSKDLRVATHMIEVPRWKHKHVEIEVPSEVKPGEEITLRIKAVEKSFLGLLAVDSRVFHDEDNNDFSASYFDAVKSSLRAASPDKQLNENSTVLNLGLVTMTNTDTISNVNLKIVDQTASDLKVPFKRSPTPDDIQEHQGLPSKRADSHDIWIFDSIENTMAGWQNWTTRVPNEITKWRLSAFLVDPNVGLTIFEHKPFINITSTKPLYLQFTVPQHIKVGETLILPVKCFNELNQELNVIIRVQQKESQFQLLDEQRVPIPSSDYWEKELIIAGNASNSLTVYLKAIKTGKVDINIMAISGDLNDTMIRQMKFLQKGQLISHQVVAFESLGWHKMKAEFQMNLPHQHTIDGVKCHLSGNMIAANMQTFNSITRIDNGEQLITKLLAIYYLWDYVQTESSIGNRWRQFLDDQLNDGFQSLLRFRARDGSFTYNEQPRSNCSSTWLTAYALHLMNFLQTTPLKVDLRQKIQSENFLLSRRPNNIQFVDKCVTPQRRKLDQLELSIDVLKVLQLSNRMIRMQESHSWITMEMLNKTDYHLEAKRGHNLPNWIRPADQTNGDWREHRRHIETTGRILTGQLIRKKVPSFEIYKWLILRIYGESCKENCFECFIARQAMYNYVRTPKDDPPLDLTVSMWGETSDQQTININVKNQWQPHHVHLQAQNQTLNLKANGLGDLLVRCSYEYDPNDQQLAEQNKTLKYELRVTQKKASGSSDSFLKFCVQRHQMDREFYIGTEVALHLPSGYVLSPKSVNRLVTFKINLQAGSEDGNTKMNVRLRALSVNVLTCLSVLVTRVYKVDNLQPGMLTAYDTNSMDKPQVLAYNVTF
ncbi:hypothetical protein ACLKA6_013720 [Drosophila palustris]